jgi:hypothetical protein
MRIGARLLVPAALGLGVVAGLLLGRARETTPASLPPGPAPGLAVEAISSNAPGEVSVEPRSSAGKPPPAAVQPSVNAATSLEDLQRTLTDLELGLLKAELARASEVSGAGRGGRFGGHPLRGVSQSTLDDLRSDYELDVRPLLDRWTRARAGEERAEAMAALHMPLGRLLAVGGSAEHYRVLEEAAERGETSRERKAAMIAVHTLWQAPAVDFLLARLRSPHPEVRLYAAEGLAWVRGDEEARARQGVRDAIEDADAGVRRMAAHCFAVLVADPVEVDLLLERMLREGEASVAISIDAAVRILDPGTGTKRVDAVLERLPGELRDAVVAARRR